MGCRLRKRNGDASAMAITFCGKSVSPLRRFITYFWGPIPWMIEAAALLSAAVHQWADLTIILTMLLINAAVGLWQEFKAAAFAPLKQELALRTRVLRDGQWRERPARDLVPGDIIRRRREYYRA